MGTTVAVVLAGGAGTRYDGPTSKLLAPLPDGTTLVDRAVGVAVAAGIGPVLVVTGAVAAPPVPAGVHLVANPKWAEGQATSLRTAAAWAAEAGAEAVVVGLGDQPGLEPEAWRAVAAATATPLAIATYAGRRGHPVRLGAEVWGALPATGDVGARDLLRAHPDLVVEVPCAGDPVDIDTVADLERFGRARPGSAGAVDDDERAQIRSDFDDAVNMRPQELEDWLETPESKAAGDSDTGESTGHRSGRRIVEIKRTKVAELTDDDHAHMRKVVGYVKRHLAQRPDGDVADTTWAHSLRNWGHDPTKGS